MTRALVVGAGPAGLTIARLLALRGWRVVVASEERAPLDRLELLAPAAKSTVAALGLAPLLRDEAVARSCLGIRRPQSRDLFEDFLRRPEREGFVVDRARFDARLREAALAAGVETIAARVIAASADGLRFIEKSGRVCERAAEGVVIDATGRAAAVARRRGAKVVYCDRRVAERVERSFASDDRSRWLDYENGGADWRYRIRGPGGRAETWRVSARPARAGGLQVDASARLVAPAAGDGWIAIGDAATAYEPIASQGLYNALASAALAAGLLLSPGGLTQATADAWTAATAATFAHSQAARLRLAA